MALLMTILTVTAVLAGISLLLWFSAFFEARHLGPVGVDLGDGGTSPPEAALGMVDVQSAA